MPVKLTLENLTTDRFAIKAEFDLDALKKVDPCQEPGEPQDNEANALIAMMFERWCDHKASVWFEELAKAARRVELAEAVAELDAELIGPVPQPEEVE